MFDLLKESLQIYNLPFTILLALVIVYWVIALCGMIDLDALDFDFDLDADGDGTHGGPMSGLLKASGFADAPLILILSLLTILLWATNLLANYHFNPESSIIRAMILFTPVLLISAIITRLLIKPLAPLMNSIKSDEPAAQIIGEEAKVISASIDKEFGRVEVDFDGKPILLNAILTGATEKLRKGDAVLVVSKKEDSDTYKVRSLEEAKL